MAIEIIESSRSLRTETIQLTLRSTYAHVPAWGEQFDSIPGLRQSENHICPECQESALFFFNRPGIKIKCMSSLIGYKPFQGGYYKGAATVFCPVCKSKFYFRMQREFESLVEENYWEWRRSRPF